MRFMTAVTLNLAFYRVAFKSGGTVLMIWIKRSWFCGFGQKDEELVVEERKEESVGVSQTLCHLRRTNQRLKDIREEGGCASALLLCSHVTPH